MESNGPSGQPAGIGVDRWFEEEERAFTDVDLEKREASDEDLSGCTTPAPTA